MQKAQETLVTDEWVPVGFYIPGLFTADIQLSLKNGKSHDATARRLMKIQQEMHATCSGCGTEYGIMIWSKKEALRLCRHAETLSPTEFREMVETEYRQYLATCPRCGRSGHPRTGTLHAKDGQDQCEVKDNQ